MSHRRMQGSFLLLAAVALILSGGTSAVGNQTQVAFSFLYLSFPPVFLTLCAVQLVAVRPSLPSALVYMGVDEPKTLEIGLSLTRFVMCTFHPVGNSCSTQLQSMLSACTAWTFTFHPPITKDKEAFNFNRTLIPLSLQLSPPAGICSVVALHSFFFSLFLMCSQQEEVGPCP